MKSRLRYMNSYVDRHGRKRHYLRKTGQPRIALPGNQNSIQFRRAYEAALRGEKLTSEPKPKPIELPSTIELSRAAQSQVGVYLLLLDGEIVYVGSSLKMKRRVADHRTNGRPFDKVFFIPTTTGERLTLERTLIAAIKASTEQDASLLAHQTENKNHTRLTILLNNPD